MDKHELFGEAISVYSRAQAIEDGELVNVSEVAREAGFRYPVCVTRALWAVIEKPHANQDTQGRLWDVLWMLLVAIRGRRGSDITYRLHLRNGRKRMATLRSNCGPGDDAEPVITIGYPEDF